jgi:hypothetical protein
MPLPTCVSILTEVFELHRLASLRAAICLALSANLAAQLNTALFNSFADTAPSLVTSEAQLRCGSVMHSTQKPPEASPHPSTKPSHLKLALLQRADPRPRIMVRTYSPRNAAELAVVEEIVKAGVGWVTGVTL